MLQKDYEVLQLQHQQLEHKHQSLLLRYKKLEARHEKETLQLRQDLTVTYENSLGRVGGLVGEPAGEICLSDQRASPAVQKAQPEYHELVHTLEVELQELAHSVQVGKEAVERSERERRMLELSQEEQRHHLKKLQDENLRLTSELNLIQAMAKEHVENLEIQLEGMRELMQTQNSSQDEVVHLQSMVVRQQALIQELQDKLVQKGQQIEALSQSIGSRSLSLLLFPFLNKGNFAVPFSHDGAARPSIVPMVAESESEDQD
ncbi:hypothetical protein HDV03_000162 [Kappamyces sp. JEL0829]|nr:hypothetical protein HDV03_000162 [Kappamyces sp. JEL0829]